MVRVRRVSELLADHSLPGREAADGRGELVLSRGKFGYVAKYRWIPYEGIFWFSPFDINSKQFTNAIKSALDRAGGIERLKLAIADSR